MYSITYSKRNSIEEAISHGSRKQSQTVRDLPLADKQGLLDKRNQLQSRIHTFHQKIQTLFSNSDWDKVKLPTSSKSDGKPDLGSDEWLDDEECPEKSRLLMPSALGKEGCKEIGWGVMMEQELELRIGQANDSLEKLRLALGLKAVVYKTGVRPSKSQSTKTRARSDMSQVNKTIEKHSRSYRLAYQAILNLGASEDLRKRFQPLTDKDLGVGTDLVEENRMGQRSDVLAWIWRQGDGESDPKDEWMKEGE